MFLYVGQNSEIHMNIACLINMYTVKPHLSRHMIGNQLWLYIEKVTHLSIYSVIWDSQLGEGGVRISEGPLYTHCISVFPQVCMSAVCAFPSPLFFKLIYAHCILKQHLYLIYKTFYWWKPVLKKRRFFILFEIFFVEGDGKLDNWVFAWLFFHQYIYFYSYTNVIPILCFSEDIFKTGLNFLPRILTHTIANMWGNYVSCSIKWEKIINMKGSKNTLTVKLPRNILL